MRGKLLLAGIAGIVAVAAMFFGGVLGELSTAGKVSADLHEPGLAPAKASRIAALERLVAHSPSNGAALIELGLDYQQRARETADPTDYGRAEAAFRRGPPLWRRPLSRPDWPRRCRGLAPPFREAVDLARRAIRIDPDAEAAYGILGDGLVELGRYRRRLCCLRPHGRTRIRPSRADASLLRARAPRATPAGDRRDADGCRDGFDPRERGLDPGAARKPRIRRKSAAGRRGGVPPGAGGIPGLLARGSRPCPHRCRTRPARGRSPPVPGSRGENAAAAVRDRARRRASSRPAARRKRARRTDSSVPSSASSARTACEPSSRPRCSTSTTAAGSAMPWLAREAGVCAGAEHPCGGRAGMGALQERPLRRRAGALGPSAPPRNPRRAQALPPRHDRALSGPAQGQRDPSSPARSLSTGTSRFSMPPVARKALR